MNTSTCPQNAIKKIASSALLLGALAVFGVLSGCASGPNANPRDPLEPFNRKVSDFNQVIDHAVLKPVATGYRNVVPDLVRTGVSNFFSNLGDAWSAVNNVLQLKPLAAAESLTRFGVNTLWGLGGILDVASEMSLERHKEDFGQTLGRWGVPSGPYVVLPLLGPSTLRDTVALPVDVRGNLLSGVDDDATRAGLAALHAVDVRSNLLRTDEMLDSAALDKYSFTRDAYLQLRRNEVYDGNPPEEDQPAAPGAESAAPGGK